MIETNDGKSNCGAVGDGRQGHEAEEHRRKIENDRDFVICLLEEFGIGAVHGEAYGLSPHFRLSFAASMEDLDEACRRNQTACQALC